MDDRKRIAAAIRDHLARERISREQFAFKTKLGKSTVDKLLVGLFLADVVPTFGMVNMIGGECDR